MKNRHGVEYTYVKYDDNLYRFNMSRRAYEVYLDTGVKKVKTALIGLILVSLTQAVVHLLPLVVKSTGMRFTKALSKSR
jgi:hypothetical protein